MPCFNISWGVFFLLYFFGGTLNLFFFFFLYLGMFFSPENFNKFAESKCYLVGNLVLLVELPLTTSAEVPGSW